MEIYAPLSDRMGMNHIRDELEDLSFQELNPEARNLIVEKLSINKKNREIIFNELLKKFEKVRIDLAETLGISHFDISDHILYKMKDRNKKWGYFTKYYDIEMNSINVYVKFLDFAN